jgi:hypothetical protein
MTKMTDFYCSVTATGFSAQFERKKLNLDISPLENRHTGENIRAQFERVIDEWQGLKQKLHVIACDGASSNNTVCLNHAPRHLYIQARIILGVRVTIQQHLVRGARNSPMRQECDSDTGCCCERHSRRRQSSRTFCAISQSTTSAEEGAN